MFKLFCLLLILWYGCASNANLERDIIITENVVHKKDDTVKVFTFPPRGVSLNLENYDWLDMLRKEKLLKPDTIIVDELPKPIKTAAPTYPEIARKYGQEGVVYLIAWINIDGTVRKAAVVATSDNIFIKPALDVVMDWKFTPASIKGKIVEVSKVIPFKFKINQIH